MSDQMTKAQILEDLHSERAAWEALLAEVSEDQMTEPGVVGEWSVKNIVAHVNTADRWIMERLWELVRGEEYQMTGYDRLDDDTRNAITYEQNHDRPLGEVLEESGEAYPGIVAAVEALAEEDLADSQRWTWAQGNPQGRFIAGNSYRHYTEHAPAIRHWLDRQASRA